MKRLVINIQTYGDFDIPGTDTIMLAPEGYGTGDVAILARSLEDEYSKTRDSSGAIKELKSMGFTVCKDINCNIGGDL